MINDEEGRPQKTQEAIKQTASTYYSTLLTETKETEDYSDLLHHMPKGISEDINADLTKEINEEEIHDAIWALQPDKAPGGFLANRQISDSILLVQEAIHSSQTRNEKGFILKLDLANAFDRVRHSFLFVVLEKMGFATSFISLIKACITGPWISPLLNGRPGPSFQSSRGLRQGCPLSPYLFILMAESFCRALDYNHRMGLITGIKFDNGVKNINHSQFANDTLLMGGASNIIARRFKTLLDKYMSYSGGLINHLKSCIYGWNTLAHVLHRIACTLGVPCKLNWEQFTYLGMPVSAGNLKAIAWEVIIDKMKRKIQHWGTSWLNPVGRIILLKAGLSSLPLYCFTLLQAPANFHFKMDGLLRHFLWQGGRIEKKNTTW
eukprot:PITA_36625